MKQTYDISKSYQANYDQGPLFDGPAPELPATTGKTFLGLPVNSRLGIAAGLLLNSRWILGYADWGYDILTYKTVRSSFRPCYPLPNWVFIEEKEPGHGPVYVTEKLPEEPDKISSAVCFGMPSMAPEVWREDVKRARKGLREGQILVVSVVATPSDGDSMGAVAEDFARCARWAVESGAHVIEANLSCPNVCSAEGTIYLEPAFSQRITEEIRRGIGEVPLLLKVGHFPEDRQMQQMMEAVHGLAQGITMVNGMTRPVLHRDGSPAFGKAYVEAGVLGQAIHDSCVRQVGRARRLIEEHGWGFELAGVGGVASPQGMGDFLEAGADAVLLGSSPMYDPGLAVEIKRRNPEW